MEKYQMFIGGRWVNAASEETTQVIDPSTEEDIATVPRAGAEDVNRAAAAAKDAFEAWSRTTPSARASYLWKTADLLESRAGEIAALESRNTGKPVKLAADSDIPFSLDNLRYFAGAARHLEGQGASEYSSLHTSIIRREPLGVVASIAPWNYPLMMAVWKIGPALAAGNTVILKPSEWTPLSALEMAKLAADIFPPGVLNVITGDGEPVGSGLVRHPGVAMVSLTGDVATGREVAKAAAQTLKRVHLELGGKAPVIVFDDADLEAVNAGIRVGAFFNSGQDCTAA